ncbi:MULTISPECIES: sn-glycerol-3-phosphate ABC transporter ATP-binding protein UgpC [unclassified Chelatococcus]|uniref:ABC transporter ATP-binding protein n=1 Tax=unclassified Chelatococcus TaxID=2638111 RepID=UPI001BD11F25|nr:MULTISPECIES: sn-glycerol-3-phosphate ABC transporter ATP-binding protein UgpC [unclassified Chelatococcus]MBS7700803.1 sn-glycerol-3-phosphate ABC transporter ATP-binding protein UgpC [Chelatococcus sp. YT9]MBX3559661.1 sn-glycerol-3-phosphate ABC transporter ATP-binding protein UgpC [Chelatococcus sp.]
MASIRFAGVRKVFDDFVAVERLDLTVADGEFVVFVGPSGCGKTTSLRMLAGLEDVTDGHIWVGPRDVTADPPKARDMAMVFQNYALYPHMTVAENIGFSLGLRGVPKADLAQRVRASAEMMGIAHLLDHRPRELSGGQRQRVAVCRAIVRNPSVFLFDEPLSNLDPQLRTSARGEIRALQRRLGVTSVYVTHDQIEAMTMADRIVVMRDGEVQQIGTPEELFERPQTIFVASFIGAPAMNIVSGSVENGQAWALGRMIDADSSANGLKIGVRPEDICFRELRGDDGAAFRVDQVEMIGSECLVHGEVGSERLVARVARHLAPRAGERIGFDWPIGHTHMFDLATGTRIASRGELAA